MMVKMSVATFSLPVANQCFNVAEVNFWKPLDLRVVGAWTEEVAAERHADDVLGVRSGRPPSPPSFHLVSL